MKKISPALIFKKTLSFINERIDNNALDNIPLTTIERQAGVFREELRDYLTKTRNAKAYKSVMRKGYYDFLKDEVFKRHRGLKGYRLSELSGDFQRELKRRTELSLSLIKSKNQNLLNALSDRFVNWLSIDSAEVKGVNPSQHTFLRFLDFRDLEDKSEKQIGFILKDQSRKLRENMDSIIRENLGAIGGFWRGMRDKREVGNPNGYYPHGNDSHGDHWNREGKFYVFSHTWADKQGLVKGERYEDLKDGGAGVAIGCRCWIESIYNMQEIPKDNLTRKGAEYLARNQA